MENTKLSNLKEIREKKGFSRRELSVLSGVNQNTINFLENGWNNTDNVRLSTLIKLSKALHCKVVDLVDKDLQRYIR